MTNGSSSSAQPPEEYRIEIPEEHRQRWTASTYHARSCALTLEKAVDPKPDSYWVSADSFYKWEKASIWIRSYLLAGAEHLGMWSDIVAPYKLHPEAVHDVRPRPLLLLARAGLEAAAHALWLTEASSPLECAQRHIRLMYRDFTLHRDALIAGGLDTTRADRRIDNLEARCKTLSIETAPKNRPPGYEKLVRLAAARTEHDADRWSYLWNAASGAAHGQNWFGIEGFGLMATEEYEPGYFRTIAMPDLEMLSETVEAACSALDYGTLKWLIGGGHRPEMMIEATREVFKMVPKNTDARKDI